MADLGKNTGVAPDSVEAVSELAHTDAGKDRDDMTTPTSKRTTSPAFQFYPNDFLGDPRVQVMSATEVGVYWLLICACWNEPSGLPFEMRRLAATSRMKPAQFERAWAGVLHECFDIRGDRVFQRRVEKERKKQAAFNKQQKVKADKRWQSHGTATAMPGDGTRHAVGNALQSSSSSSSSSSEKTRTARASTVIQPRRKDAAWEGPRVWVPQRIHNDFLGYRGGNEAELRAWYEAVDREFAGEIDPEMFNFWRARYREKWPSASAVRGPAWISERV